MKLIYFAPYRWWESCGSPKKVGGADVFLSTLTGIAEIKDSSNLQIARILLHINLMT